MERYRALLEGDMGILRRAIQQPEQRVFAVCVLVIVSGAGVYGPAMGRSRCEQRLIFSATLPARRDTTRLWLPV